jgi:hypothetical protein
MVQVRWRLHCDQEHRHWHRDLHQQPLTKQVRPQYQLHAQQQATMVVWH